jgi:glycosyltransferase involved in cell wall biosynthesis
MRSSMLRIRFIYEDLGASTRYRVHHHVEQARLAGLVAEALPIDRCGGARAALGCDLLYLHRLRLTRQTLPLILAARARHVPVVFDSDDLVWDESLRAYDALDAHHPPRIVRHLLAEVRRTRWLMCLADAFVFSTSYLAVRAAETFRQPVYTHPNALSQAVLFASSAALASRPPPGDMVTIAYFSGTRHVHDEDLASVGVALRATLDACPQARLLLVGEVALPAPLVAPVYAARVERRPLVGWRELPFFIARVDINLAPLIDNPQRRAKSAVKYLEAAAVGVPTLASHLDPYMHTIADGTTGLLARDSSEWVEGLIGLVRDRDRRRRLGEAARRAVLGEHTTTARAPQFRDLIEQLSQTLQPRASV